MSLSLRQPIFLAIVFVLCLKADRVVAQSHLQHKVETRSVTQKINGPFKDQSGALQPLAENEALFYYDEDYIEEVNVYGMPSELTINDGLATIDGFHERFTSSLADPVLDSITVFLTVFDIPTGQFKVEIHAAREDGGEYIYPDFSNTLASFTFDGAVLIPEEANPIKIDCSELRLGKQEFFVTITQHTLSEPLFVVTDSKSEIDPRELDPEIDRAYMSFSDEANDSYVSIFGGIYRGDMEEYHYPNLLVHAYLHQFDGSTTTPNEWKNTIQGSGEDKVNGIIRTADGGHMVVGGTNSTDGDIGTTRGGLDFVVGKFDKLGKKQWIKTYGGSGADIAYDAVELNGGKYVIAGSTMSGDGQVPPHSGASAAWVIWLDLNGNITQSKSFGTGGTGIEAYSITADPSGTGGVMLAGKADTSSAGSNNYKHGVGGTWIAKLKPNGDTVYTQTLGGAASSTVARSSALHQLSNGSYAVATRDASALVGVATIQFFDLTGKKVSSFITPTPAPGTLVKDGDGRYATIYSDTLITFDQTGAVFSKHWVAGLLEPQSISIAPANRFVILGKSKSLGDQQARPAFFVMNNEGKSLGIKPLTIAQGSTARIEDVLYDSLFYLVAMDQRVASTDIVIERTAPPTDTKPALSIASKVDACRGETVSIKAVVQNGIYPIVARWLDNEGDPLTANMIIASEADGVEFALNFQATRTTEITLHVSQAGMTETSNLVRIQLGIETSPEIRKEAGELVCTINADSYQWLNEAGEPIAGATAKRFLPTASGMYAVRATSKACTETSQQFQFSSSSVKRYAKSGNAPRVSFSQATKNLAIDFSESPDKLWTVSISNALGQRMLVTEARSDLQIEMNAFASGVYFVSMVDSRSGESYTNSFIR